MLEYAFQGLRRDAAPIIFHADGHELAGGSAVSAHGRMGHSARSLAPIFPKMPRHCATVFVQSFPARRFAFARRDVLSMLKCITTIPPKSQTTHGPTGLEIAIDRGALPK
ncbi:hypothetical protein BES08_26080 (plasmid) [Novosphingobium resinovorum]|uniref:Uncharacterized protein n=1 Tax=Novosphingobium resinovorum TaxID=158500 RepID=A0A1D8AE23_9SPHN|nr:hypothetical protein BES08_26080 [Novosphingobium resinovorum]